jgi:UDP-N-acetylmuramate dehydrogenase
MNLPNSHPEIQQHVSLQRFNTFGLEGFAEYFVAVESESQLITLLQDPKVFALPKFILGGGSNMLLVGDLQGLVIHNKIKGFQVLREDAETLDVAVAGGEVWHDWVLAAIGHGWGGLENLSLIPGNVGAAPIQNIGAYGVELKDLFQSLRAIDLQTGNEHIFSLEECRFGYRDSVFKTDYRGRFIIVEVTFRLQKAPHTLRLDYGAIRDEMQSAGVKEPTIKDVSAAVIAIRQSKLPDPAQIGNAGSFFKNPEVPKGQFDALKAIHSTMPAYVVDESTMKIPAGWLIEQAGWKGKRLGNYGVHAQQALVLVNYGGAQGLDILALSKAIMDDILQKFGVQLEREVNVVGA